MSEVHIVSQLPCVCVGLLLFILRLADAQEGQMLPRGVSGSLPIAKDGKAQAVIVAPSDPETRRVAEDLASFLRELTGIAVPVIEDENVVSPDGRTVTQKFRDQHLVLVGNALNNRAIFPLYCRWLDAADGRYPGGDGYELRTVVNPYGGNRHELILGASTPAGARQGLKALKAKLTAAAQGRDLVLPQMLEVQVGAGLKPTFERAIAGVKANPKRHIGAVLTTGHLAHFCKDALSYAWTGEVAFAKRAKDVLLEMNRRFDGYYHGDVRSCDDYSLEYAVRGWMILQHAGVLSNEELLETDRNLFHDVPFSVKGPGRVGSRHKASGAMAFFLLVDSLLTYGNPDVTARETLNNWREGVRAYFHSACQTYRGDVDQTQDYGAMENVFRYAIHDGYWEYFDSGWADRAITQMLMNADNLGAYSGVGGYGEAMPGALYDGVAIGIPLRITAFMERRGDLRWICENIPKLGRRWLGFIVLDTHLFDMGDAVPAAEPKDQLTGLTVLHVDDYHHKLGQSSGVTDGVGPITVPRERCVDKLMFRDGFAQRDQYLLLNGYQSTLMNCLDGNAIVRFCDQGEVWLFQSTQEEGHYTKNAVWVSNGRNTDLLEGCVELLTAADLGTICVTSTRLPRYHGTDWERTIFWRRGAAFVVFDLITVKEAGVYVMACTWRSPRYARLCPDGSWKARTEAGAFTVRSSKTWQTSQSPPRVSSGSDGFQSLKISPRFELTNSMDDDRFSAEVPWTLRQWKRSSPEGYKNGQIVAFQNVFFTSSDRESHDYSLRRLSDDAALLRGACSTSQDERKELSLLAIGPQKLSDGLSIQSSFSWIGDRDISLVGARRLEVGGKTWVQTDKELDISLRPGAEELRGVIQAKEKCELSLALPGLKEITLNGGTVTEGRDGVVQMTVPPGRHSIVCRGVKAEVMEQLAEHLNSLWRNAKLPRRPEFPAPSSQFRATLPLRSVWTYDGLKNRTQTARDVWVTSRVDGGEPQPGPLAVVGDTFKTASASWSASQVEVTLTLPEETQVTGLRITLFVGAVDFNDTRPNPVKIAQIAFSNDDFTQDARLAQRSVVRSFHYRRPYYGGELSSEVVDTVEGLKERAKAVRLILQRPEAASNIRLGRVQVLTDGKSDSVPLKCQAVELVNTDAPQWAVWNPNSGRISLIDFNGREIWQRDLGAAITGVACDDVNGDGENELAITSADLCLRLLDAQGQEVFKKDWRGMYEATGGHYYCGECPHGVGIFARPGQREKEMAVGHYYFLSYLKADGTLAKTVRGTACFWQDFINTGVDLNGDGFAEMLCYSETPWQGRVPVVVLDGVKRQTLFTFPAGNGGARLLQMLKIGEEDCVAVGSHKGCGIYSLTRRAYKWYMAGEIPKTSFFVTDLDNDGAPEMLVGQRDGSLLVVNVSGEVVQQWNVGEAILAVGALPGTEAPVVLVCTLYGSHCYDARGRLLGHLDLVAQTFEPATSGERPALLALHGNGRVEMLQRK